MKKYLSIILCTALVAASVAALTACSARKINQNQNEISAGGWAIAESPEITDEIKALFKKSLENLDGVSYTPVAYLASQIVAGKNHCILCKVAPIVPEPETEYKLVYIYEKLDGSAEITSVVDTGVEANYPEGLTGGWIEAEASAMTKEATNALSKATKTLTGAEYSPVSLLATQVVAGKNYRILCIAKPTVPNAEPYHVIVTVYEDLEGNAQITDTAELAE